MRRCTYTQDGLLQCGFTHNTQGPRPHVQTSDKRLAIEASHPGRLELGVQSRVRERMYYTVQVEHIIRCTVQIHCIRVYYFWVEINSLCKVKECVRVCCRSCPIRGERPHWLRAKGWPFLLQHPLLIYCSIAVLFTPSSLLSLSPRLV